MKITWDEFQSYLIIDRKLSSKAGNLAGIRSRFTILMRFFADKPFTREDFNLFILGLKNKGKKNAYLNNFIKTGKHLDRYLKLNILQDYTYFREDRRAIDILTPEEIEKIITLTVPYSREAEATNFKYRCLFSLMAYTGCRISEALTLLRTDLKADHVIFRSTKNGEDRIVPLPVKLVADCLKLPKKGPYVFGSRKGEVLDVESISVELKRRAALLHIEKPIYNHLLRHSFITTLLSQGVDPIIVGRIVGHTDINSTKRYDHRDLNKLREYQMMHPLLRESITLDTISKTLREHIGRLIDRKKYILDIQESTSILTIRLKKVYA